jgi:2,3-dihydroxyphenylpropionate 1,2-dioxygenase
MTSARASNVSADNRRKPVAEIVAGGALSHSPLLNFEAPEAARPRADAYRRAALDLGARIRAARPDVLVVFAQDHFRNLFYDNMPAFLIGVGPVERLGDWHGRPGPLRTDTALARHVTRALFDQGFEPAVSYDLKVDHGVGQALELLGLEDVPTIPVLINAAAPPLPTPARCYAFGEAMRAALASFPEARRVAVIGSGGLSHQPSKAAIESDAPEDHEANQFLIHGRGVVAQREEARIQGLMSRLDELAKHIRPDWDRAILSRLAAGEARALAGELTSAAIEQAAGTGGQEVRAWLAMLGAAQPETVEVIHYDPVPFLVTGMGIIGLGQAPAAAAS